ncbi:MAG: hypothetical protein RRZ68_02925 [Oscillospiraceae bacterium]
MKETMIFYKAIIKSLIGIALILVGIMFAQFQVVYVSLPLSIIGILICFFSYLNIRDIDEEKE